MASLRRSHKTLSPDGQTARFLYTIIKQLDLKTIDWNEVAGSLDITNGHAARMRFSRFKQCIEGTPAQGRGGRASNKDSSGSSGKKSPGKGGKSRVKRKKCGLDSPGEEAATKMEGDTYGGSDSKIKNEFKIKTERGEGDNIEFEGEGSSLADNGRARFNFNNDIFTRRNVTQAAAEARRAFSTVVAAPPITPANVGNVQSVLPTAPPQATVSLADLQLAPTKKPVSSAVVSAPAQAPLPVDAMEGVVVSHILAMPTPPATPAAVASRVIKAEETEETDDKALALSQLGDMVIVKDEPVAVGC